MTAYDPKLCAELLELHEQPGPAFVEHINAMAAQLRAASLRIEQLERALRDALEAVKVFHGPAQWDTYWNQSPEMKRARAALGGDPGAASDD